MDYTEYIALAIVAIAATCYVRGFFKKKGDGCCKTQCSLQSRIPKSSKSDHVKKTEI